MSLCATYFSQTASIKEICDTTVTENLLVTSCNPGGLFVIETGKLYQIDSLQSCGLWFESGKIYRGIQDQRFLEVRAYDRSGNQHVLVNLDTCDVHDVRIVDDQLMAISTSSNEIVSITQDGCIKDRITFPGSGDAWHINCFGSWDNRLVVSAFGNQFFYHREWKGKTIREGIVFDLESKEVLLSELSQPHSPRQTADGTIYVCDSQAHKLLKISKTNEKEELHFPEYYTRGLAFGDNSIYLGLSLSRNLDNSSTAKSGGIAIIDKSNLSNYTILSIPIIEVYEVMKLNPEEVEP